METGGTFLSQQPPTSFWGMMDNKNGGSESSLDIEAFLDGVLVRDPVPLGTELLPLALAQGLGLSSDLSSGQQGSNGRKQGSGSRPEQNTQKSGGGGGGGGGGSDPNNDMFIIAGISQVPQTNNQKLVRQSGLNRSQAAVDQKGGHHRVQQTFQAPAPSSDVARGGWSSLGNVNPPGPGPGVPSNTPPNAPCTLEPRGAGPAAYVNTITNEVGQRQQNSYNQEVFRASKSPNFNINPISINHPNANASSNPNANANTLVAAQLQAQQAQQAAYAAQAYQQQAAAYHMSQYPQAYYTPYPAYTPQYAPQAYYFAPQQFYTQPPPNMPARQQPISPPENEFEQQPPNANPFPKADREEENGGSEGEDARAVKRPRLIWTQGLHKRFLDSVEKCGGVDKALPKAITKRMGVIGLTRENVASHLQKYRLRLKKGGNVEDVWAVSGMQSPLAGQKHPIDDDGMGNEEDEDDNGKEEEEEEEDPKVAAQD